MKWEEYKQRLIINKLLLESSFTLKMVNCGFIQYQKLISYYEVVTK